MVTHCWRLRCLPFLLTPLRTGAAKGRTSEHERLRAGMQRPEMPLPFERSSDARWQSHARTHSARSDPRKRHVEVACRVRDAPFRMLQRTQCWGDANATEAW